MLHSKIAKIQAYRNGVTILWWPLVVVLHYWPPPQDLPFRKTAIFPLYNSSEIRYYI